MRALYTSSGHYLFPVDDPDAGPGPERVRLRQAVKAYFDEVVDEDIPKSTTLTQETALMARVDSERDAPALASSTHALDSHSGAYSGKMVTAPQRAHVPDSRGAKHTGKIVAMSQPATGAMTVDDNRDEEARTSESRMRVRKETVYNSNNDTDTPYFDSKEYYRRWHRWKAPRWT
eukprot:2458128-Pyramimonas_sp.AAC.1